MTFHVELYPEFQSAKRIDEDVDVGGSVQDMVRGRHAVVAINNRILPLDQYDREPIEGDYVVIRAVPTETVAGIAYVIGSYIASAATAFWGVAGGYIISAGVSIAANLAIRSLVDPPEQPDRPERGDRLPGLSGQSNRIDPFGTVDKIYGEMRTRPKLGAKPYTEVAGDDQYLRMLLVVGHGPLRFTEDDIEIGDTLITNYDDYEIEIREGWPDDTPQTLYKNVVDEVSVGIQSDITDDGTSYTRTTESNSEEITLDLVAPGGIQSIDTKGQPGGATVHFKIEIRESGGSWYEPSVELIGDLRPGADGNFSHTGTCHFDANTRDTIRGSVRIQVAPGQYDVRVTRKHTHLYTDTGNDEQASATGVNWTLLRSFIANTGPILDFPNPVATISLRIRATDQLNGVIDNLSVYSRALVEVPGSNASPSHTGMEDYAVTSNPVWHFRDALVGYGPKTQVNPSEVADLQPFADFADARGYQFDARLNPKDRYSIISQILSFARGSLDMSNGLFGAIWEHEQPATQMFTPRNSWDFSANRGYPDIPHALRTQYIDTRTWEQNEVIVYRDGFNKDGSNGKTAASKFEQFDISDGCTDDPPESSLGDVNNHPSIRMAVEKLREAQLRLENFSLSTDFEWLAAREDGGQPRGSRVKHAHDAILIGLGSARITAINGQEVSLDQTFEMKSGPQYGIEIRDDTSAVYALNVDSQAGIYDTVTVQGTIPGGVNAGDLVAFGETDEITQDLIIKTIDAGGDREAQLELVPYAPEIYNINQPLPDYDFNITQPVDISQLIPGPVTIESTRSDESVMVRNTDGSLTARIVVITQFNSGNDVPTAEKQVQYRVQGSDVWENRTFGRNERIILADVQETRTYNIRVRSVSPFGQYSAWTTTSVTVVGKTTLPPDVTGLTATFENFNVRLAWESVNRIDVRKYQVEQKYEGSWQRQDDTDSLSKVLAVLPTDQASSKVYEFRVRAEDAGGLVSPNWTYVNATVNAPASPTVEYSFDGPNFVLMWTKPTTQYPISEYVVRRNGTPVDSPKTNVFSTKANWEGDKDWSVSAIDVAGNEGPETIVTVTIEPPSVFQNPSQIIGNNVLLYWEGTPRSLPIAYYEIHVGSTLSGSDLRGTADTTFFSLIEDQAGTFTYWIVAVDTAGNESNGSKRTNTVNEPGGYRLYNRFVTPFSGDFATTITDEGVIQADTTHTNALVEDGRLLMPVDTSETWQQHFDNNGWTTIQDQIDAGFPIYAQPTPNSGQYQAVYDCGVVIPGSKIVASADSTTVDGSPSIDINLEVKEQQSDAWTDLNASQAYTTNFRFIRVTVDVTTSDTGMLTIDEVKTIVNVEIKREQGRVAIAGNPTTVSTQEDFLDITNVNVSIADGTRGYVAADWNTPDSVDYYAWDLNGNPTNLTASYEITGN